MKNIYPFNVFSIDTDLFHFKLRICEFLLLKFLKAQKELLVANICGIETIAHRGSKIWDSLPLEIKQKKM